ncbi:DUF2608 domain-containing protein [Fastidiosibacter lacustris]|uniref:DUF2608 domain-containing protein n=1 Tax=Fastidiosibacter lacustris TaxID=2056695 RepID=UPI000E346D9E|nr:DUF2608 domain-containing protein [Fastidiosibacter lacustris]
MKVLVVCAAVTFTNLVNIGFSKSMINQKVTITQIKDVEPYVDKLSQKYGKDSVCMVYDIDNTLITNNGKYASERWTYWQQSEGNHHAKHLLKDKNANIYDFLNAVRYFINYSTVEKDTVQIVNKLQSDHRSIALTSRGFSAEATTLRQLRFNGIDFTKNPIGSREFDASFLNQNKYKNDYTMYSNGIQYAAGGDKGELLYNLIKKEREKTDNPNLCQALIYIDDTSSKVDMIDNKLKNKFSYYAIHYTYLPDPEDKNNWQPDNWHKESSKVQQLVDFLNTTSHLAL